MRSDAWRDVTGEVKSTGRRLKKAGAAYVKAHPLVILGGGAAIGALVMGVLKRRPRVTEPQGLLRYLRIARFWFGRAALLATDWAERAYLRNEEACAPRR